MLLTVDREFNQRYPKGFGREDVKYAEVDNSELVLLNYTSGTTGFTKGVMISANNLAGNVLFALHTGIMNDRTRIVSFLPLAHDSYIVKEYERLKGVVSSEEFIQFKEFWSDPHRWTKTEAYKKEEKFKQLSQHTDIEFYQRTDPASFAFQHNWNEVFNDEFNGVSLDRSIWNNGYYFSDPALIRDYSLTQYKQANNEGKNVSVADGCMVIETLKESTNARAWDEKLGFVLHDFSYTSDVINAGEKFQFAEGIVEVKMRVRDGDITHVECQETDDAFVTTILKFQLLYQRRFSFELQQGIKAC